MAKQIMVAGDVDKQTRMEDGNADVWGMQAEGDDVEKGTWALNELVDILSPDLCDYEKLGAHIKFGSAVAEKSKRAKKQRRLAQLKAASIMLSPRKMRAKQVAPEPAGLACGHALHNSPLPLPSLTNVEKGKVLLERKIGGQSFENLQSRLAVRQPSSS